MKLENNLEKDKIGTLVLRLALPSMLAQFVSVLYSIVDRMYIGNIAEVGELALAGAGVCGPIVTLISSFASLIGFGGSPLLSIRMGEKREDAARQILANCFMMMCVAGIILTAAALLLKDRLLWWFGASEATFPYADAYLSVYVSGSLFALLSTGMNQFIITQGFAKVGMMSVVLGAVLNLVLDPIFMFVFGMGTAGAAFATVLSQMASSAFVLWFLFSKRVPIPITFGGYSWKICKRVLALGLSPFLIIAFDSILIISMNMALQHYGGAAQGDTMVACATIVQSFMLMITMPLGGITGGTQTILGYNYGAGQIRRVRQAEMQILKVCLIFTSVMFVAAQTASGLFVNIFTRREELKELAVWAIRVYTLGVIPLALQYTFVDGFTGMGIAKVAVSLSFFRKGLFFLFVFFLPMLFGVRAAFFTEPLTDVIAACVTTAVFIKVSAPIYRKRLSVIKSRRHDYNDNKQMPEVGRD